MTAPPSTRFIIPSGNLPAFYEAPPTVPARTPSRSSLWILQELVEGVWCNDTLPLSLVEVERKYCARAKESPLARFKLQAVLPASATPPPV